MYSCSYCVACFDGQEEFCTFLSPSIDVSAHRFEGKGSRQQCLSLGHCVKEMSFYTAAGTTDVRVAKSIGRNGYYKLRISAITDRMITAPPFTYSKQFQYRWTSKYLNTGEVAVEAGLNSIDVDGEKYDIFVPEQGTPVRGVMIADPCFQSEFIVCFYQKKFNMFNHTIELLNAINSHDDTHFWMILGDNFYDQSGDPTSTWFNALSKQSKSKIFGTIPGNHDFWVNGSPKLWAKKDQQGNGFFQFYGQSTAAAAFPYDFTVNPDTNPAASNIPPASNFFWYNQIGNAAFIGFSGAHSFQSTKALFEEACAWATEEDPSAVYLLGHWDKEGDGCDSESSVPSVHAELLSLDACRPIASRLRYFEGHMHCNIVVERDTGFMVGGNGMLEAQECGGEFGIPVLDTSGGTAKVYYFPIVKINEFDNFENVLSCIKSKGVSGCYDLAVLWSSVQIK